ncbi:MAG: C45 family autoproteolytic acyltransferase/hydrolase [Candidatus Pacearchaeota archaeon]|nr:C45 family autoproteolytic acyltransferase/hydrolase [Candidatus Pacearchaeota archaeon]
MDKITLSKSPYQNGKELGKYFLKHKTRFPIKLNKFQKEYGKESVKLLEKFFPEATEEIRGITDTIKQDYEIFASWLMCMGCCLIFRENHNVEVRGCTAFSFVHNNKIYYGRNNDLPPYLKEVSKSIFYNSKNKNKFILNTSSFVNGEEGINEFGLVVAMTFVIPKKGEVKPGFNSLFLVRYILENCKTVEEGIKSLQKLPIASSCNILLADRKKEMVIVECHPDKINIRKSDKNKNGEKFVVTVNHFTSKSMQKYDRSKQNVYSSKARYETAYASLKKEDYKDAINYAKDILSGKHGFMCQYKNIKFETIWSSIFNISDKNIYLAKGNPENTEFIEDKRLK